MALLGGLFLVFIGIIDQEEAFGAVDWNVIFPLAGMMVVAVGSLVISTAYVCWRYLV